MDTPSSPDAASGQPPAQEGTGGPVYTYTAGGRLATRVWKRGVTTTYSYNTAGDLQTIDYSDSAAQRQSGSSSQTVAAVSSIAFCRAALYGRLRRQAKYAA
ncbi:MAG: hypothetical protein GX456_12875 [Verrucomicrobia bacterium]|nr:hypothetical protein [Verrucomicrobiota bacterium]